jgi:hypothetical protein
MYSEKYRKLSASRDPRRSAPATIAGGKRRDAAAPPRATAPPGRRRVELPSPMLGQPGERYEKVCYRYRTHALVGPWRRRPEDALEDAIKAKQVRRERPGDWRWIVDGTIEESFCDRGGPCGGVFPPE